MNVFYAVRPDCPPLTNHSGCTSACMRPHQWWAAGPDCIEQIHRTLMVLTVMLFGSSLYEISHI